MFNQTYLIHHVPLANSGQNILLSATIMIFELITQMNRLQVRSHAQHMHKYGKQNATMLLEDMFVNLP